MLLRCSKNTLLSINLFQSIPSVIQLVVIEDQHNEGEERSEIQTETRKYTYDELLDLQSRLMLVAGQAEKGKENVDRFLHVS